MPNGPQNSGSESTTTTTTVADDTSTTTTTTEAETTTTTTQAPAESKPMDESVAKGAVGKDKVLGDETKTAEQLGDDARAEALGNHAAEHAHDGEDGRSAPTDV